MSIDGLPIGTVIMVPATGDNYLIAQIVFPGVSFYLVGFRGIYSEADSFDPVLKTSPIIGAWTNDAEIYKGRWKNRSAGKVYYTKFRSISYKYMNNGQLFRQSFDGETIQGGRPGDERLPFKLSISPLLFGKALCAVNGIGEWKSYYEKLLLR